MLTSDERILIEPIIAQAFNVEHQFGGWVNWQVLAIGYLIGKGKSAEEAVKLTKKAFGNVKSSDDDGSGRFNPPGTIDPTNSTVSVCGVGDSSE